MELNLWTILKNEKKYVELNLWTLLKTEKKYVELKLWTILKNEKKYVELNLCQSLKIINHIDKWSCLISQVSFLVSSLLGKYKTTINSK